MGSLEPGTTYVFQIRAANGEGDASDPSDERSATPMSETDTPDQVQELTVSRLPVTGELKVSWRGVAGVSQYYLVINNDNDNNRHRVYVPGDTTSYTFKHTSHVTGSRVGIRAINWDANPAWTDAPAEGGFRWFSF